MQGITDNLEQFAKRIESRIKAGMNGSDSMERLICRILTSKKNPTNAAMMAQKWVDWRYGKNVTVKMEGHIEHTVFDASRLSDEQLAEAERLVESASTAVDKG